MDRIIAWVEHEYDCEVAELSAVPIRGTESYKVTGEAWRRGKRLLVGGVARPHNLSGVRVFDETYDPFEGL